MSTKTAKDVVVATVPDHGRTPENTPLPGGGRWGWDAIAGCWIELRDPGDQPGSAAERKESP